MLLDQINIAVREHEPDVDLGIERQEVGDDREEVQSTEENRGRQNQFAAWGEELPGGDPLGLVDHFENAPG